MYPELRNLARKACERAERMLLLILVLVEGSWESESDASEQLSSQADFELSKSFPL